MECVQWPTQAFLWLLPVSQLVVPRHQEFVLMTPESNRKALYSLKKLRYTVMRDFLKLTRGKPVVGWRYWQSQLLTSSWLRFHFDFPKAHRGLSEVLSWKRIILAASVKVSSQDFSVGAIKGGLKSLCPSCPSDTAAVSVPFEKEALIRCGMNRHSLWALPLLLDHQVLGLTFLVPSDLDFVSIIRVCFPHFKIA